jgi:hypothetical protein
MDDLTGTGIAGTRTVTTSSQIASETSERLGITETRQVSTMVNLTGMRPADALASTGFALANPATANYVVYAPSGGTFTVDLSGAAGKTLDIRWMNVSSGNLSSMTTIVGGSSNQSFTSPYAQAALILTPDANQSPLTTTTLTTTTLTTTTLTTTTPTTTMLAGSSGSGLSPDGYTLLAGGAGSLVTSAGTWSFGSAYDPIGDRYILLNGQPAAGDGVELQVANQGNLYAVNAVGNWYEWMGGSWAAVSGPGAVPPGNASTTGTGTSPADVTLGSSTSPADGTSGGDTGTPVTSGTSDTDTRTSPPGQSDTGSASFPNSEGTTTAVSTSASGGDSPLAVFGNDTTTPTLTGGTSPVDPTTFQPDPGNDYLHSRKTTQGHGEIANLNGNMDQLPIAPNLHAHGITSAAKLVSGATVSNGNSVLHLSPTKDITFLEISQPSTLVDSILVS